MSDVLASLRSLHEADEQLLSLQAAVEASREAIRSAEAEAASARTALDGGRGQTLELKAKEGLKEMELKDLEGQILSWNVKLNTTRDNKEYQGILQQIAHLKERKGALEEEILGLLDQEKDGKVHNADDERRSKEADRRLGEVRRAEEARIRERELEAEGLRARRESCAQAVPPEILSYYERLRPHRGGRALAAVAGGVCQGCHLGLTPNQVNQVALSREVVKCLSCGRILYPAG